MRRLFSLILGACALTVAVLAVALAPVTIMPLNNPRRLADSVPAHIGSWQSTELKVGETEILRDAVERTLRFDDVIYREYCKGSNKFSLYIAYWEPGKTTTREVAFHTPDHCWVSNGWKLTKRGRLGANVGKSILPAARQREFEIEGQTQYVVYWHLADGYPVEYAGIVPSDLTLITDLLTKGFRLRREQYFIRISSSIPFDQLLADEEFVDLLRKIGVIVIPSRA